MTSNKEERPKFPIGVNVFVIRDNKLLLGMRKNAAGDGQWGLPGGHVELNEAMKQTARRELEEETGLVATEFKFLNLVNQFTRPEGDHYVQVGMQAQNVNGKDPELCEPDRCYKWEFFNLENLPENIFFGHTQQIENFVKENNFTDQ